MSRKVFRIWVLSIGAVLPVGATIIYILAAPARDRLADISYSWFVWAVIAVAFLVSDQMSPLSFGRPKTLVKVHQKTTSPSGEVTEHTLDIKDRELAMRWVNKPYIEAIEMIDRGKLQ